MMIRVNDKKIPWREGMTVSDVLEALNDPYPYMAARINGRLITRPNFTYYVVPDHSEVHLMPLITGG